jgi:hypothetical protein
MLRALHPWSVPTVSSSSSLPPGLGMATLAAPEEAALEVGEAGGAPSAPAAPAPKARGLGAQKRYALSQSADAEAEDTAAEQARQAPLEPARVREKTVRPVAFEGSTLPGVRFSYDLGSLPPGQAATAKVWIVGPWLRGLWLVSECAGLAVVLALLMRRSRRLWWDEEVAP